MLRYCVHIIPGNNVVDLIEDDLFIFNNGAIEIVLQANADRKKLFVITLKKKAFYILPVDTNEINVFVPEKILSALFILIMVKVIRN